MNVIQMEKGKERWSMIADDIWDMILGKAGRLPGEVAPELEGTGRSARTEVLRHRPASQLSGRTGQIPPDDGRKKGWDTGQDDEELFEYAMHPSQYEAYKSGKAKTGLPGRPAKETRGCRRTGRRRKRTGTAFYRYRERERTILQSGHAYGEQAAPAQTSAAPTAQPAAATGAKAKTSRLRWR